MTWLRIILLLFIWFVAGMFYTLYKGEDYVQNELLLNAKNLYQNVVERLTEDSLDDNNNELDESLQWIASGTVQLITD